MKTRIPLRSVSAFLVLLSIFGSQRVYAQVPGLWSMTYNGGTDEVGTIIKTAPDGTLISVKHNFTVQYPGARPYANAQLIQLPNGKLYGVTSSGGTGNGGVLFEYDPATGTYAKKFDFVYATGREPHGALALGDNGKLYGTTAAGGANNVGVIYEYDPATGIYTKKIDLTIANGSVVYGSTLYLHSNGKFYGMTYNGGTSNLGVLFEYDYSTNTYTKKIDFNGTANGAYPYGRLVKTSSGKIFGVTSYGGVSNKGTLFEYNPATNTLTKRADFSSSVGSNPFDGLVEANNNLLYGVATVDGSLYEFNPTTYALTRKVTFDFSNPANGTFPYGILIKNTNGKLYGMASGGGATNNGILFEYDVSTNTFSKKIDLNEQIGAFPYGSLLLASNGNFFGMTYQGGNGNLGVLFEYNANTNVYTKKLDFGASPNGSYPLGGLVRASNNKLYGLTNTGGTNDGGVIFEIDPITETFAKKYDFVRASGAFPQADLTQAPNGKLYGMTPSGGVNGDGVIFEFDPVSGTYTTKYDFDDINGSEPIGSLMLASNNKFYGTANEGGTSGYGVLFEYDPATNTFTKKTEFDGNTVGYDVVARLMQAANGKFYGLCRDGGANGNGLGTLFEYDLSTNTITVKVTFSGVNGETPEGGLVQASNGKLYGVTRYGGAYGKGVLFEYDIAANAYIKKHDFGATLTALAHPTATLGVSGNGKLYGSALYGGIGNNDKGGIFEYDPATSTLTIKSEFTGLNGRALLYGSLLFVDCQKPDKPVVTRSNENTSSPTLTSSSSANNQWYKNDVAINGATSSTLSVTEPGVYKVQVLGTGCNSDFSDPVALVITGNSDYDSQIQLYPNPVTEWLTVRLGQPNTSKTLRVLDMLGKAHTEQQVNADEARLFVGHYPPGAYILSIQINNSRKIFRFIKN